MGTGESSHRVVNSRQMVLSGYRQLTEKKIGATFMRIDCLRSVVKLLRRLDSLFFCLACACLSFEFGTFSFGESQKFRSKTVQIAQLNKQKACDSATLTRGIDGFVKETLLLEDGVESTLNEVVVHFKHILDLFSGAKRKLFSFCDLLSRL